MHVERDRDLARCAIAHEHWDEERRNPVGAPFEQYFVLVLEGEDAADARCEYDADPVAVVVRDRELGVGDRLACRHERELREAVHAARLFFRQVRSLALRRQCAWAFRSRRTT